MLHRRIGPVQPLGGGGWCGLYEAAADRFERSIATLATTTHRSDARGTMNPNAPPMAKKPVLTMSPMPPTRFRSAITKAAGFSAAGRTRVLVFAIPAPM